MLKTNWLAIKKRKLCGRSLWGRKLLSTSKSSNMFVCEVSGIEPIEARSPVTIDKTFCFLVEYSKRIVNQ